MDPSSLTPECYTLRLLLPALGLIQCKQNTTNFCLYFISGPESFELFHAVVAIITESMLPVKPKAGRTFRQLAVAPGKCHTMCISFRQLMGSLARLLLILFSTSVSNPFFHSLTH